MGGVYALTAADMGGAVAWISPTYRNSRPLWRFAEHATAPVARQLRVNRADRAIEFPSGGWIGVYSADSADSIRGESFDVVVIDEAAHISEEAWTDAIQPTLADRAGHAMLISTPRGKNWFYREYVQAKDDAASGGVSRAAFTAPSSANPNPNIKAAAEMARERVPERTYRQEWLAEFIDDGGLVFRRVRECAKSAVLDRGIDGHTYVFGVDWGKTTDFTVIQVMDVTSRQHVYQDRFNQIDYAMQRGRLAGLVERFAPKSIIAEANAMGAPIIEQLQRDRMPVRPFTTTNATKTEIVEALALAFERGDVGILPDAILLRELEDYEGERMKSGLMQYGAPAGSHDDCVMALALAWQGCLNPPKAYGF